MTVIRTGMLLAAGRGERMMPLTLATPKPLLEVRGRTLLDRALDQMEAAGATRIVVNACHLGDMIANHLEARAAGKYILSREEEALETGGGVCKALPLLGDGPFFAMNGDGVLEDRTPPALARLLEAWDDSRMDALLLVLPLEKAHFFDGPGNFHILPDGSLVRGTPENPAPCAYIGAQILHPRLFDGVKPHCFSLRILYAKAQEQGRLFGVIHNGAWLHIGTPQALSDADAVMERLGVP